MRLEDLDVPFAVTTLGRASGTPVIVLPGGPCRGPEYLDDLAGLGDEHPLVILHPRGTPLSGGLSRGWWSDADDVVRLADALGLDAVDLVAHSAGTRLALATAARFPARVRSLALVTPPASWLTGTPSDAADLAATRDEPEVAIAVAALEADDPRTEAELQESWRRQAPAGYARWTDVERTHASIGAMSLAAASAWFTDIPAGVAERLREATMPPTLVVGGAADLLTGVRPVEAYAAALGARLAVLPGCGHYPWIEQPEAFRRLLGDWLTTVPSGATAQSPGPAGAVPDGRASRS